MKKASISCSTSSTFPASYFSRHNEFEDRIFYSSRSGKVYLDEIAQEKFRAATASLLSPESQLLELTAGAYSYLPPDLKPIRLVGVGLNAEEMAENPQLSDFIVQDLNQDPSLPFAAEEFDGGLCTCGIQYLIKPLEVFCEVNRVLKPGGVFIVSYSRDCFPEKTIAVWLATRQPQHQMIVTQYFSTSGNWHNIKRFPESQPIGVQTEEGFCAVWAEKDRHAKNLP